MNKNVVMILIAILLIINGMIMLYQSNQIVDLKTKLYIMEQICNELKGGTGK